MPQHRKQVTYSQRPNHAARSAHARGERQFRTYDTSYIRPKKSKAPAIVAAVLAVLVVGGLAWGALTLFNSCSAQSVELLAEGQEPRSRWPKVLVPRSSESSLRKPSGFQCGRLHEARQRDGR